MKHIDNGDEGDKNYTEWFKEVDSNYDPEHWKGCTEDIWVIMPMFEFRRQIAQEFVETDLL